MNRITTILLVAAPIAAFSPSRYTIAPGDNIHERVTMASKRCLDLATASNTKPASGNMEIAKHLPKPDLTWFPANKAPDPGQAVRWPDDPTDQLAWPTAIKVLTASNKCKAQAEKGGKQAAESFKGLNCS